jgi:hypothetical protein
LTTGPAFHLVPLWFCAVCPLIVGPHRKGLLLPVLLLIVTSWLISCLRALGWKSQFCNSRRSVQL